MDNAKKELIKTELKTITEKLKKNAEEAAELLAVQNYWHRELGIPEVVDTKAKSIVGPQSHTPILAEITFRKGDFYGLPHAQAAYEVLKKSGGILTTDQILKIFQDTGYDVGGVNPKRTLYVSLSRSSKILLVASNTFDLAERRPNAKKGKKKSVKKNKNKEAKK